MKSPMRIRGLWAVALMLGATTLVNAQQPVALPANAEAALNFRFSASEIEAVVHARNRLARAIATTPGLGNQIVAASQGNPTIDEIIARLRQLPQVKQAYNNSGLTVRQGVLTGSPASIAATRDMYMSLASPWITLPMTTWPTLAGSTLARATASRIAIAPSFVGATSFSAPP